MSDPFTEKFQLWIWEKCRAVAEAITYGSMRQLAEKSGVRSTPVKSGVSRRLSPEAISGFARSVPWLRNSGGRTILPGFKPKNIVAMATEIRPDQRSFH